MSDDITEKLERLRNSVRLDISVLKQVDTKIPISLCALEGVFFCPSCKGAIKSLLAETALGTDDDGFEDLVVLGLCENSDCSESEVIPKVRRKKKRSAPNVAIVSEAAD